MNRVLCNYRRVSPDSTKHCLSGKLKTATAVAANSLISAVVNRDY